MVGETEIENPLDLSLLNDEQRKILAEFAARFHDFAENNNATYLKDEKYLIHWLKARKFKIDAAEKMLMHHLRCRQFMNLDATATCDFKTNKIMEEWYSRGSFGHDKSGRPIAYFPFGGIDPKGLMSTMRFSEAGRTVIYWQETRRRMCAINSKKFGKNIQQAIYIMDLKGIGTRQMYKPGLDCFVQISRLVEQHTPEIIYKVFVLNAPSFFATIFALIKPVLDENTQRKIHVFGSSGWEDVLLEHIDADQLPVYYGGTATEDGDPKCSKSIRYGGEIPKEMYMTSEQIDAILPKDVQPLVQDICVSRSSKWTQRLTCEHENGMLLWYFHAGSHMDIGFNVFQIADRMAEMSDDEILKNIDQLNWTLPPVQYLAHIVPEYGMQPVRRGNYLVVFDNSYSWLMSKPLRCWFDILPADSPRLEAFQHFEY